MNHFLISTNTPTTPVLTPIRPIKKAILTKREIEILKLIAYEHTNLEIAQLLHISFHTVDSHRKSMQQKLKVKNTAGLIRRAFEISYLNINLTTRTTEIMNRHPKENSRGLKLVTSSISHIDRG